LASSPSRLFPIAFTALVAAGLVFTHETWMGAMGRYLVKAEEPEKADIAVVLAGDGYGHRIRKAADLVKQGFVPQVLVSGPTGIYGHNESDLAIPFIVKQGYPEKWFIALRTEATSTTEEADSVLAELRKRKVKRFLLVTSDFHTRRAGSIFKKQAGDLPFRVIASKDEYFRADSWWRERQAGKVFVFEWTKTVANWCGI
jgi:uncharacterized SAM-binding protein YcdF (DUF218 family)